MQYSAVSGGKNDTNGKPMITMLPLDLDYLEAMGQADRPTASITWSDATLVNRMYEVRRGEYL